MIRLENIEHSYSGDGLETRTVLNIPAWAVERGAQVLLRGVSGSGKTTLFNVTAGLMHPTRGEVYLDGQPLYQLPEAQRDRLRAAKVGYVFQTHHLMPGFSALENIVMPMMFAGTTPPSQRVEWARALLASIGLADHARHKPHQLSAGQRLRVSIARALANRPALLLADEPTAALDHDSAQVVMDLLQETCRDANAALIVASHDPALEKRFAVRVDLIEGRLTHQEVAQA